MAAQAPNVVYILADDMGYGDLSCLNPESKIRTEHLDRIAAGGMRFTDAHSSSAVCTPSRYSILTGRYNWRSELKQGVLFGYSQSLIEPNRATVASMLQAEGYRTACVGKWHLGWEWARNSDDPEDVDYTRPIRNGPNDVGFDHHFGIAASLDMPPYVYVEDRLPTAVPERDCEEVKGKGFYRGGPVAPDFRHEEVLPRCTEHACAWIREAAAGEAPFFLYFPLTSPHTPILPTERFDGASGTNAYGDFCLLTDWCVGAVRRTLEEAGVRENTILVFTSDNGCSPMADFAELATHGHNPSYVFRGHKADIYEGGHRIPLLVEWPAGIAPDAVCEDTVCLADLYATLAEILGVEVPDDAAEDSVSNLALWQGRTDAAPVREATVHHSINGSFSIRKGRWKLEFCPGSGGWSPPRPGADEVEGLPPIQLYDLEADIGERANLQDRHPEVVQELTDLMTRYVREGRSTPGAPQPNTGPRHWPQLNWLAERDLSPDTPLGER
ncbi:MAG: sulfatase family protein [Planctomycetota bacterium]